MEVPASHQLKGQGFPATQHLKGVGEMFPPSPGSKATGGAFSGGIRTGFEQSGSSSPLRGVGPGSKQAGSFSRCASPGSKQGGAFSSGIRAGSKQAGAFSRSVSPGSKQGGAFSSGIRAGSKQAGAFSRSVSPAWKSARGGTGPGITFPATQQRNLKGMGSTSPATRQLKGMGSRRTATMSGIVGGKTVTGAFAANETCPNPAGTDADSWQQPANTDKNEDDHARDGAADNGGDGKEGEGDSNCESGDRDGASDYQEDHNCESLESNTEDSNANSNTPPGFGRVCAEKSTVFGTMKKPTSESDAEGDNEMGDDCDIEKADPDTYAVKISPEADPLKEPAEPDADGSGNQGGGGADEWRGWLEKEAEERDSTGSNTDKSEENGSSEHGAIVFLAFCCVSLLAICSILSADFSLSLGYIFPKPKDNASGEGRDTTGGKLGLGGQTSGPHGKTDPASDPSFNLHGESNDDDCGSNFKGGSNLDHNDEEGKPSVEPGEGGAVAGENDDSGDSKKFNASDGDTKHNHNSNEEELGEGEVLDKPEAVSGNAKTPGKTAASLPKNKTTPSPTAQPPAAVTAQPRPAATVQPSASDFKPIATSRSAATIVTQPTSSSTSTSNSLLGSNSNCDGPVECPKFSTITDDAAAADSAELLIRCPNREGGNTIPLRGLFPIENHIDFRAGLNTHKLSACDRKAASLISTCITAEDVLNCYETRKGDSMLQLAILHGFRDLVSEMMFNENNQNRMTDEDRYKLMLKTNHKGWSIMHTIFNVVETLGVVRFVGEFPMGREIALTQGSQEERDLQNVQKRASKGVPDLCSEVSDFTDMHFHWGVLKGRNELLFRRENGVNKFYEFGEKLSGPAVTKVRRYISQRTSDNSNYNHYPELTAGFEAGKESLLIWRDGPKLGEEDYEPGYFPQASTFTMGGLKRSIFSFKSNQIHGENTKAVPQHVRDALLLTQDLKGRTILHLSALMNYPPKSGSIGHYIRGLFSDVVDRDLMLKKTLESSVQSGLGSGKTAYHLAAEGGNVLFFESIPPTPEVVVALDAQGKTAYGLAIAKGHSEVSTWLKRKFQGIR